MACPYLEYRKSDGELEFDRERPCCTVVETFVSPMKADICNDRYDFNHAKDCDLFRERAEK